MSRVLMITNEVHGPDAYGFRDELEHLHGAGVLDAYEAVAPNSLAHDGLSWAGAVSRVVELARRLEPTVILVLSPKAGQWSTGDVARLLRTAASASVSYWEGDPWGRRNRPNSPMRPWLRAADQVFTTALGEQYDTLRAAGARRVRFVPNTYCHVRFADAERSWEAPVPEVERRVVMVASRAGRISGISTVPGARQRWHLVRMASRRFGDDFRVYGRGWTGRSAFGFVPYAQQVAVIRSGGLSVNWDHYPRHAMYSSDRLPTALVAGRPHVTTKHPGMDWLPSEDLGLFQAVSPAEVVEAAEHLRTLDESVRADLGRAVHAWVTGRFSHRQAVRYMLRESGGPEVEIPEVWSRFVTVGDGRA
jgi:hypothetical protein